MPTPNLFTGMQNIHGPQEWVSVQDMARATEMCIELAQSWSRTTRAERPRRELASDRHQLKQEFWWTGQGDRGRVGPATV